MIKAVFIDIDGTLLSHHPQHPGVPPSAVKALQKLQAKGVRLFMATGRHPLELAGLPLPALCFDGQILLNGSLLLDSAGRIIQDLPLSAASMALLGREFRRQEYSLMFVEKDRMYVNITRPETIRAQASISTPVPPAEAYTGAPVYQAVIYGAEALGEYFRAHLPECSLTAWSDGAFDITPADSGKAQGVRALLRRAGISPDEAMAIGDGENDAGMLSACRIGVAMGNASARAKAAADYVTAAVWEDGLALALAHFAELGEFGRS